MEYCNHLLHALSKRQHVDGLFQTLDVSDALFSCCTYFCTSDCPTLSNRPTFTESKGIASLARLSPPFSVATTPLKLHRPFLSCVQLELAAGILFFGI
jgi:hypothetical protein